MANRLSIPEAMEQVGRDLRRRYGDKLIARDEIIKEVVALTGYSPSSVIPADFCYNRSNKGARPVEYCVFVEEGRSFFRYVGRGYSKTRSL